MLWTRNWRETTWSLISQPWDMIIIGGGITGAGILREATRLGLRCLLVEQRDFAWGASSRSSKLIHGGLRYLVEGKLRLTREAVGERERLLKEGTDLVQPVGYLFPIYRGCSPSPWSYHLALSLYDLLASHRYHRHYSAEAFQLLTPHIAHSGLIGGFRTREALIDDARLVLRVLQEAVDAGGTALNYVRAQALLWDDGRVVGVRLQDREQERTVEVGAKVVINATGAWADQLRGQVGARAHLRPLRGSHLIFPSWRLSVPQAVKENLAQRNTNVVGIKIPRFVAAYGVAAAWAGDTVAVGLIAAFSEAIPMPQRSTMTAFGFNAPSARAPQAILLAVPPKPRQRLSSDLLVQIMEETQELAYARTAHIEDLGDLQAMTPTTWLQSSGPVRIRLEAWPLFE